MTEPPKLPDIVEHLREAIREGAGQLAENCIEEITRLRARLEMDGVWQLIDGKMQRISVEPGSIPDGIECRDETIKLQDAEIARLRLRSPAPAEDGEKLWLWRDGKDRFLAFRSLFPLMPDGGDPATIGQPSGYAFYHPMTLAEAQKVSREAERTV